MQTHHSKSLSVRSGTQAAAAALTLAAALSVNAQAQPTGLDGIAAGSAVVAIVKVPKPWYAPRFLVVSKMRDTIAQYQRLPGLAFKAYSFAQADGDFGGIYLWKDLASARAWFAPAWFERVQKERGVAGEVRFFEVVAAMDTIPGGTPADTHSATVATLTTWPMQAGANKAQVALQFQAAQTADRQLAGLLRRYYIVTDQDRMGHVSLWRDKISAQNGLGDAGLTAPSTLPSDGARHTATTSIPRDGAGHTAPSPMPRDGTGPSADPSSDSAPALQWSDTRDLISEASWRQSPGPSASRSSTSGVTVEWFDTPILTPSILADNVLALTVPGANAP